MKKVGIIFDGTLEGLYTIVYNYYYEKIYPTCIVEENFQPMLGIEYTYIESDFKKSDKVIKAIINKFSLETSEKIYRASLHEDEDKFTYIFKYIILAFKYGNNINNYLNNPVLLKVNKYSDFVNKEVYRQVEFCRFVETKNNIFYSDISPKNNILILVAEFFVDRFNNMYFIIHDLKRNISAIYDKKNCVVVDTPFSTSFELSKVEKIYQELWDKFYNTIGIEKRKNTKRLNQLVPKYYRKHMTEFRYIKSEEDLDIKKIEDKKA